MKAANHRGRLVSYGGGGYLFLTEINVSLSYYFAFC